MLFLQNIDINENEQVQECFTTDNPRIKKVIFTYVGQTDGLDDFLKSLIFHYGQNEKLIA